MSGRRCVEAVNREAGLVVLDDGQQLSIEEWFRAGDAAPCAPAEAVACTAGPDDEGRWYAVDLTLYRGRVH